MTDAPTRDAKAANIEAYKTILRDVLDQRPSGTRQRLATALGKNRSFISQMSNPAYSAPIPAPHLEIIFEICHFPPSDKRAFLDAFRRARMRFEQRCGAHGQIVFRRHVGDFGAARDESVVTSREVQRVAPVEQLEHGLQRVIAIRPAAGDVQEEIQLRWREAIAQRIVRFNHESGQMAIRKRGLRSIGRARA